MDNSFRLSAIVSQADVLRHTPAGVPILEMMLTHQSWQEENGTPCLIKFQLPAKIIGSLAAQWHNKQGCAVEVQGFLAQKSQKNSHPILRIQNIKELK